MSYLKLNKKLRENCRERFLEQNYKSGNATRKTAYTYDIKILRNECTVCPKEVRPFFALY